MKAVGYLRVSDPSQVEGHSLDAQERLFHELCRNRGWEPGKIYREEGRSAHVEAVGRRPVFRQLLEDAGHSQFDIIVVHTLDRWSRNQRVMLESLATLARHNVSLVSITENIDYSTPQGKLFTQMLGSFAEYFSDSLSTHVSKGMEQRAYEGRHTGGIPFGYDTCWIIENRKKRLKCETEHPGGVHLVEREAQAVRELFRRYSLGTTTLSQLAVWLNREGFRTRNTKKLPDSDGQLTAGPRLFTTASVRGILHNPFYMGKVSHKSSLLPGVHEPLVSPEMFETVQAALKKNSGRSETLNPRPKREYLLKGLIRCAYCGMPMWAQTYNSGRGYYREETRSRSGEVCPAEGASMPCHVPDGQVGKIVEAIELGPKWLEEVLAIISLQDQVQKIREERGKVQEKLRRMAKAYMDGLFPDDEYHRQKRLLEMELEGLVVPEANAAEEAGRLVLDLPNLWAGANLTERHKLLMSMLDAIYVDARDEKRIVALKPKPAFRPVFQVATTREGSGVELLTSEPPEKPPEARPCFWWRRGRVGRYLKHGAIFCLPTLSDPSAGRSSAATSRTTGGGQSSSPLTRVPFLPTWGQRRQAHGFAGVGHAGGTLQADTLAPRRAATTTEGHRNGRIFTISSRSSSMLSHSFARVHTSAGLCIPGRAHFHRRRGHAHLNTLRPGFSPANPAVNYSS